MLFSLAGEFSAAYWRSPFEVRVSIDLKRSGQLRISQALIQYPILTSEPNLIRLGALEKTGEGLSRKLLIFCRCVARCLEPALDVGELASLDISRGLDAKSRQHQARIGHKSNQNPFFDPYA